MDIYDFDQDLNSFAQDWYECHSEGMSPDDMENAVDDIFLQWADRPIPVLGCTPVEYFGHMPNDELFAQFNAYLSANAVPSVLTDELSDRVALTPDLRKKLFETTDPDAKELIMALLEELGDTEIYREYIKWIADETVDDNLVMHASEIMQENVNTIADDLEEMLSSATDEVRDRISDLLVYARRSETGYRLLCERFIQGKDMQLYAVYLGMYGDERAVDILKKAALTCDYVTFIEIRNAVERLGADWDTERDFSDDPNYALVKGENDGTCDIGSDQKE